MERENIELIIDWIDERVRKEGLSLWTKRDTRKLSRNFLIGSDWFTIGEVKTRKFPDELLSEDGIKKMLEACKNPRRHLAEPEEHDRKLKAVKCPRCFKLVGSLGNFCLVRGYPLTSDAAMKVRSGA
ncbi:hypothetical protein Asulf_00900 [Archaeoglobus sulfaticallidus PM70-1]|uniref:Uncharacterized protein n=1 Tax=Archaeoglobus sulfaticallidus PM70-1 TaxID=387631 RepID=N0BF60_9EURY|nr:hypothetical protein [Archaeoglobus sulfaticallidus]AGK60907.1 hypothetical protein Asulf_00900 [Archaeoglobus sulfaticallidus PM70-1]